MQLKEEGFRELVSGGGVAKSMGGQLVPSLHVN